jgi:hypothetical protein
MGILGWIVAGPRIVQSFRAIVSTASPGGRAARLLALLLIALLAVQCLPFDFETSPADWYRKYRDGGVTIEPFQEWTALASDSVRRNDKVRAWLELVTLFVPVGVLMSYLSGVWSRWSGLFLVATGALIIGTMMEAAQWPVHSRHPSVTDVTAGSRELVALGTLDADRIPLAENRLDSLRIPRSQELSLLA